MAESVEESGEIPSSVTAEISEIRENDGLEETPYLGRNFLVKEGGRKQTVKVCLTNGTPMFNNRDVCSFFLNNVCMYGSLCTRGDHPHELATIESLSRRQDAIIGYLSSIQDKLDKMPHSSCMSRQDERKNHTCPHECQERQQQKSSYRQNRSKSSPRETQSPNQVGESSLGADKGTRITLHTQKISHPIKKDNQIMSQRNNIHRPRNRSKSREDLTRSVSRQGASFMKRLDKLNYVQF